MWLSLLQFFISTTTATQPAYPVWHKQFQINFNETMSLPNLGVETSDGSFIYDYVNGRSYTHRINGTLDRYCGLNGFNWFTGQPCDHYVIDGDRFIDYPEHDYCCYCCSASHGCGMLFPEWMENAEYLGIEEHMGQRAYKWNKKGLQDNFYWETVADQPADRVVLGIYQEPEDLTDYDSATFSTDIPNGGIVMPSRCKKTDTCPQVSICTKLRSGLVSSV